MIKNSVECRIDLNAKEVGGTGFHYACRSGHIEIVELLIKNSVELNFNLNAKANNGFTGFHYACFNGHVKMVELLIQNSVEFHINLNAKNENRGLTGYALSSGQVKKLIRDNSAQFNIDL